MSSEPRALTEAKAGRERAVGGLEEAQGRFDEFPLNLQRIALAQALGEDPLTFSPELLGRLKGGAARTASDALEGALRELRAGASASGVGATSGPTNLAELKGVTGFANTLADRFLTLDEAAARQRPIDLVNAANLLGGVTRDQFEFDRLLAQAELGSTQTIVGAAGQPSPLEQIGGGLGGLAGIFGGALAGNLFPQALEITTQQQQPA